MSDKLSLQSTILLNARDHGYTLMRNNIGRARKGNAVIAYGVGGPGGSDLIGWRAVQITPEMVGKTVAVFAAVEVKEGAGRASADQRNFLRAVESAGGIAILARRLEDLG
jgi:hypothetical protein